jgi:hypothetical protein
LVEKAFGILIGRYLDVIKKKSGEVVLCWNRSNSFLRRKGERKNHIDLFVGGGAA